MSDEKTSEKTSEKSHFEHLRDSMRLREVSVTRTLKTETEDFGLQFTVEIDGYASDAVVCTHMLALRADVALLEQAKVIGAVSDDFFRDQITSIKRGYANLISTEMTRLVQGAEHGPEGT